MIVQVMSIACIAFLLLILVSTQVDANVVRARLNVKESYADLSGSEPVTGAVEREALNGGPADLADQRQPYHLLRGVLSDADTDTLGALSVQRCYETDFQTRFQPVHNYLQRTNNYKRATPDSCSSLMTQFVSSFYKQERVE